MNKFYDPDYIYLPDDQDDEHVIVIVRETKERCRMTKEIVREMQSMARAWLRSNTPVKPLGDEGKYDAELAAMSGIRRPLSYDVILDSDDDSMESYWLTDPASMEEAVETKIMTEEFMKTLTKKQNHLFYHCVMLGEKQEEYTKRLGLSKKTVWEQMEAIRKKAKIFFEGTPSNC